MVHFTSIVLSAWIGQSVSARGSVRSANTKSRTLLSSIAGYVPSSKVTDHNAIDLDQKYLELQLAKGSFAKAQAIYEEGGNSKSFAEITPSTSLTTIITKGSVVRGTAVDGSVVTGTVYKDSTLETIKVQYDTSDDQTNWVKCRVGQLVEGRVDTGCLADTGAVTINGVSIAYSYNSLTDNNNGRTLQGFSTSVKEKMIDREDGVPFADAKMYADYYGRPDYGDHWIQSAFNKGSTSFTNGNANFSSLADEGRIEVIKKATVGMNVFMYVIREFEDAIVDCNSGCDIADCNDDPAVHAWDEGVAFYSGSEEKLDGFSSGFMLHQLADKRCQNFKTCGKNGNTEEATTSFVNVKLVTLFQRGQRQLLSGECAATKVTLAEITKLMYIPFIQGTLKYAWAAELGDRTVKQKAEGAVFAAAVLPRIHASNANAAKIIHDNIGVNADSTSFSAVKKAFESVYPDLGISCGLVGGYLSGTGGYRSGAAPCGSNGETSEDDKSEDDKSEDDKSEDDKSEDDKSEDDKSEDDKSEDDKSADDASQDDGKSADDASADDKSQDDGKSEDDASADDTSADVMAYSKSAGTRVTIVTVAASIVVMVGAMM